MEAVSISILSILLLWFFVTVFVTWFVYRDAKKRGMNPLAWCLMAALIPLFLGLIMYMVCRKPLMDLQCPNCGSGVSQSDSKCPNCGSAFVTQCPECKFPVQKGWKTCPSCGYSLPDDFGQPVKRYRKDNGIVSLIVIVVVVLLVLFFVAYSVLGARSFGEEGYGYGGINGLYNITAEDMAGNSTITEWIAGCDNKKDAYVLLSTKSNTCLVYLPEQDMMFESNMDVEFYGEKCYAHIFIDITSYEDKYGYDFTLYEFNVSNEVQAEVYINGRLCDYSVTTTDKDISMDSWGGQMNE